MVLWIIPTIVVNNTGYKQEVAVGDGCCRLLTENRNSGHLGHPWESHDTCLEDRPDLRKRGCPYLALCQATAVTSDMSEPAEWRDIGPEQSAPSPPRR
jgi:hypothetical protein